MTLCISVKCKDGILLACDSKTVYGRGVPISRETNKIYIYKEIEGVIKSHIAIMGAGTVAFIDKFMRMFRSENIKELANKVGKVLSLSEIVNKVAEPIASVIYDEYVKERKIVRESPFDIIISGFETENEPDAFILYGDGLAEPVYDFGTIGSGAAYAELFLKYLLPSFDNRTIKNVIEPVCYTIRLVETIDPYVGGKINLAQVTSDGIKDISNSAVILPRDKADRALQSAMNTLKEILNRKLE